MPPTPLEPCAALRPRLETRLQALRAEQAHGQHALRALDQQRAALAETLLRISGAIQVLEELVQADEQGDG